MWQPTEKPMWFMPGYLTRSASAYLPWSVRLSPAQPYSLLQINCICILFHPNLPFFSSSDLSSFLHSSSLNLHYKPKHILPVHLLQSFCWPFQHYLLLSISCSLLWLSLKKKKKLTVTQHRKLACSLHLVQASVLALTIQYCKQLFTFLAPSLSMILMKGRIMPFRVMGFSRVPII